MIYEYILTGGTSLRIGRLGVRPASTLISSFERFDMVIVE
jgi:hypothetical protein